MTPIQQQLAALAEWHHTTADILNDPYLSKWHMAQAALLDKLAKAEAVLMALPINIYSDLHPAEWETAGGREKEGERFPEFVQKYATALMIPEEA